MAAKPFVHDAMPKGVLKISDWQSLQLDINLELMLVHDTEHLVLLFFYAEAKTYLVELAG